MKRALKFKADVKVWQGQNCMKLKVRSQLGIQLKEIKSQRTILNFDQIPKLKALKPKWCRLKKK